MDSYSHIFFAAQLFEKINVEKEIAIFSLLPALDREPPHQHRLMVHTLFSLPSIIKELQVPPNSSMAESEYEQYIRGRLPLGIGEMKFDRLLKEQAQNINFNDPQSLLKIIFAFTTHLFLDTWNNPIQCFTPWSYSCAFQWNMLNEKNFFNFRLNFYKKESLIRFQEKLILTFSKIDPPSNLLLLLLSLIKYLGEISQPKLEIASIDKMTAEILSKMNIHFHEKQFYSIPKIYNSFWETMEKAISDSIKYSLYLK